MKDFYEYAIIFEKYLDKYVSSETVEGIYIPTKIVKGVYDTENACFIDMDGRRYKHIIENPEIEGFGYRVDKVWLKSKYPKVPIWLAKKLFLKETSKLEFQYVDESMTEPGVPAILFNKVNDENMYVLRDPDIIVYYYFNYRDYIIKNYELTPEEEETLESLGPKKQEEVNGKIEKNNFDLPRFYEEITSYVIDQNEPIQKILTALWKHYEDFSDKKSRNILINGSTGVGKTEIFRRLTSLINVPCVITSATEYTATGYVGKSVDDMLVALIAKANGNIKDAERGILIIDEIDKLAEGRSGSSQVNQRDVQEALLKILEDGVFNVTYKGKNYSFDTSKLMIVGMGSWSRIDLTPPKVVGFESVTPKKTYRDITREDIVANGIIPELVGRFPVLVQMNELNFDSFVRILKSKNSVIKLNEEFFKKKGIKLVVDDSAVEAVAKQAESNNYGARGLDEIIERALSAASFVIASNPDKYSSLLITYETIEDNKKYILKRKEDEV